MISNDKYRTYWSSGLGLDVYGDRLGNTIGNLGRHGRM
jgi:hypothetical protein